VVTPVGVYAVECAMIQGESWTGHGVVGSTG